MKITISIDVDVELRQDMDVSAHIDEVKRAYITAALERSNHNVSSAAKLLGLKNRQTLCYWMKTYEIE